nr:thiamine pyrophosphate-dependent enzyme [Hyalangium minutum]
MSEKPPPTLAPTRDEALGWLRQMQLIRRFEEASAQAYSAGKIRGFLHLYIGEEACAVGALRALQPEDAIVSHYREHGHALARGVPARAIMAEMFAKVVKTTSSIRSVSRATTGLALITSRMEVVPGSRRSFRTRQTMSRSVRMPTGCPESSTTTRAPTCCWVIRSAAAWTVSVARAVATCFRQKRSSDIQKSRAFGSPGESGWTKCPAARVLRCWG